MTLSVSEFRTAVGRLSTLVAADVAAVLSQLKNESPNQVRDVLLSVAPDLLQPYMTAAGLLSATWFEDLRTDAGLSGYTASEAPAPTAEKIQELVRYSVGPLYGQSDSTVLSLLSGGAQRLVANVARDTTVQNVAADHELVGWARVPRPGCCAFCSMLASRGPVYRTEDAAVGTGYHDECHCVAVAVYPGTEMAQIVDLETQKHLDMYQQSVSGSLSSYSRRTPQSAQFDATTAEATLASMRQQFGIK